MSIVSKVASDQLRVSASYSGVKLKPTHAHELIAAMFGYGSHAALLADTASPVDSLSMADWLIPDIGRMDSRRKSLTGLPQLGSSKDLAMSAIEALRSAGYFKGGVLGLEQDLSSDVVEVLLPKLECELSDDVSSATAETNAEYGDDIDWDYDVEVTRATGYVSIRASGTLTGEMDPEADRMYSGHVLDITVRVDLDPVAGRAGLMIADTGVSARVQDWRD